MKREPKLKVVPFADPAGLSAGLSEVSLQRAAVMAEKEPHDGWADLVVHQSQLRPAMRLAAAHNKAGPAIQVRVQCETRMGRDDWKLRTQSIEVRSEWR